MPDLQIDRMSVRSGRHLGEKLDRGGLIWEKQVNGNN